MQLSPLQLPLCQRQAPPSSHILPRVHLEEGKKIKKAETQHDQTQMARTLEVGPGRASRGQPERKEGFPRHESGVLGANARLGAAGLQTQQGGRREAGRGGGSARRAGPGQERRELRGVRPGGRGGDRGAGTCGKQGPLCRTAAGGGTVGG